MTPAQLRMARNALKLGVRELAEITKVTTATITRFENERGGLNTQTQIKLLDALHDMGITFLKDGEPSVGLGVSLASGRGL
ncbi:helix-turn-helix domain-containing protein [Agrobacterium larrymoorei]|uniref:Helix-turn-helix transcriptional regulator n=1 Tax=Agrobacterium larrymoorei TaxID=160699 RepID=A0AAF0KCX9_9HYPH|nr:helix-turn-helix transcriptional regulator [Agrobacterium larrymoorei]WHA40585.1 helix-turn-helix transcriptional regulator [Agrobacterium larrymoorei]